MPVDVRKQYLCCVEWLCLYNLSPKMADNSLKRIRLEKEEASLLKDPIPGVLIHRQRCLNFHFVLHTLDEEYQGGFYHGVFELAQDYPFSPPKLQFFTPSGRFKTGQYICTTFTNYHKETWSPTWTIRSLLLALISFMYNDEAGKGSETFSKEMRRDLARKSLDNNLYNKLFLDYFAATIADLKGMKLEYIDINGEKIPKLVPKEEETFEEDKTSLEFQPGTQLQILEVSRCKQNSFFNQDENSNDLILKRQKSTPEHISEEIELQLISRPTKRVMKNELRDEKIMPVRATKRNK